jgi:class 3 adenylate cyclase/Tfp pilus assembly protein PilF
MSTQANAQTDLDSLHAIWQDGSSPDSIRVHAYFGYIWTGFLFQKPDSAYQLAEAMLAYSEEKQYAEGKAKGYSIQGITFAIKGDNAQALDHYERSLEVYHETGIKKGVSDVLNNMGGIHARQGNYPKALDCYERSLKIKQKIGDKGAISNSLGNIGLIYQEQEDYPKALEYFERSLAIDNEIENKSGIGHCLHNIGIIHFHQNELSKSLEHFQGALKIWEDVGDKSRIGTTLQNIGNVYKKQGDYSKALDHYDRGLMIQEEMGNKMGIALALNNFGSVYNLQGKNQRAIDRCRQGLEIAEEIGAIAKQRRACECLYEANKGLGNDKKALAFFERVQVLNDSLNETETAKKLQRYEFDKELLADSLQQEEEKHAIELAHQKEVAGKDKTRNMLVGGGLLLLLIAGGLFSRNRYVNRSKKQIQKEKDRSEELLLNILPEEVAEELKEKGAAEAQLIDQVTVLFTDFKGFTALSEKLSPKELVDDLNTCFSEFDRITAKYGIEKIKTIGDAYMAAGGLPTPNDTHATDVIQAALEMRDFVEVGKAKKIEAGLPFFEVRIGVHTGPVVAGIVGVKKFQYDIWGDTVNTASRMESSGEVGQVNISEATYDLVKNEQGFSFTSRGKIQAKGKGEMEMYFVGLSEVNDGNTEKT